MRLCILLQYIELHNENIFLRIFMATDLGKNEIISETQPFKEKFSHHIETSQLIYRGNQITGFYMIEKLIFKVLK